MRENDKEGRWLGACMHAYENGIDDIGKLVELGEIIRDFSEK